ncbi:MAG: hypothetical protein RMX96_08175 [Nostoc sp. ChiSLP02]|nr:hypothetical protein [Nostoc sp. DedSLP05]MDZ8102592.1 hypothetical protein [Nostoc sp. DedSLP01]MDZ8184812.1 hypothetical protein [Nostoc sp. ChiSLP02]
MTQALPKLITFNEFIEWYPNDGKCYQLHKGIIVEIRSPSGVYEKVIAFLLRKLTVEFERSDMLGHFKSLNTRNSNTFTSCHNTAISSPTFPQLNLTAQQIFDAANTNSV